MIGLKVKKYLDENGIKYSYLSEKAGIPMNMLSPTLNGNDFKGGKVNVNVI